MNWYSVKLLYKMTITGKPDSGLKDKYFSDRSEFFEESIVLVTTDSFDNAYQIAEDNARKDMEVYINKYGQTVTKKFYDSIDCFELSDSPQMLTEVYSTIFSNNEGSDERSAIDKRGSKPLTEFDDALFEAMVEKVIIKSMREFEFIFESG